VAGRQLRLEEWRVGARGKWRRQRFDLKRHGEEKGKKEKENGLFQESVYICQLTDEYKRACTVSPVPPIFISEVTSPMNIRHYIHR
jgi:hypothetical protein